MFNILAGGPGDADQEWTEGSLENDDSSVSKGNAESRKSGINKSRSRKNNTKSDDSEHMTDENVPGRGRAKRNDYSVAERMAKHKASLAMKNAGHDDVVSTNSPMKKAYKGDCNSTDFGMSGKRQSKTMKDLKSPLDQLKEWLLEHAAKELLKVRLNDDKVRWLKFACLIETISTFVYLTV
jgi:hypothetical protein